MLHNQWTRQKKTPKKLTLALINLHSFIIIIAPKIYVQTFVPGILFGCRMTHRFHISFRTVATPATVHRYIRGKIYLPDSQTVPQILNGLLFILSRQFNNQREVMASFPFKEALFVGCKALWNKPVWEVYV